ncbi:hypothetical protein [Streptomyces sp. NPDC015680]|uniref:hypothetical protein n=1 Tax=Streptomyces sp. NPDC015680 TaxID=3364962 RepID=UPI0036FB2FEC
MTTTAPVTTETILARYADDIAFVAEEQPATTLTAFAEQLVSATERLGEVGINGAEELEVAARYLADADSATTDNERNVLLNRAAKNLTDVDDMVSEFRDMV